jgi:prevent-host-death family protein
MTGPESLPVEEARKKFADVLDGTQFRSTHTEITRRGKPAGYVVPPEWYARAVEALAREQSAPPAVKAAAPAKRAVPAPKRRRPPEPRDGRPLTDEEAASLAETARTRAGDLEGQKLKQGAANAVKGYEDFAIVSMALDLGLLSHDEVYAEPERPAGSEENTP